MLRLVSRKNSSLNPKDSRYLIRFAPENDNLRDEYSCLYPDTLNDIPFARIALQHHPDAINLWIGNSRSFTAAHKDNFENIFVQIRGKKHFTLLPPVCHPCMKETRLAPATYTRKDGQLILEMDPNSETVPFSTWDPDTPPEDSHWSSLAKPQKVTLEPGDMLYLPAMWFHKVAQSVDPEDPEGIVVAVNYW